MPEDETACVSLEPTSILPCSYNTCFIFVYDGRSAPMHNLKMEPQPFAFGPLARYSRTSAPTPVALIYLDRKTYRDDTVNSASDNTAGTTFSTARLIPTNRLHHSLDFSVLIIVSAFANDGLNPLVPCALVKFGITTHGHASGFRVWCQGLVGSPIVLWNPTFSQEVHTTNMCYIVRREVHLIYSRTTSAVSLTSKYRSITCTWYVV